MKTVRVNKGNVGLVFRNGDFTKVLKAGKYWLKSSESIVMQKFLDQLTLDINLDLLLDNNDLADMLKIVEVADEELVIVVNRNRFEKVLTTGRYAFWKECKERSFTSYDLSELAVPAGLKTSFVKRPEMIPFVRTFVVGAYEKGLLFIDGVYNSELLPGTYYFWNNSKLTQVQKVDMRQMRMEISGQEILTMDKAALRVNFEVIYQVENIQKALLENKDFEKQLYVTVQLAIREFIGTKVLDELLENKESVSETVLAGLKLKVGELGLILKDVGIKDIILPGDIKAIMNHVLVAQKQAQANVITRREETASTRSLLNTAKLMEDNPVLFKLKEMEYIEKIAERVNNISLSGGGQMVDQLKEIFGRS